MTKPSSTLYGRKISLAADAFFHCARGMEKAAFTHVNDRLIFIDFK
jgi:hypothetical protein